MSDQSRAQGGSCPRCGKAVLYARIVGLLTVVEAIPCAAEHEWWYVSQGVETYSVVAGALKLRTAAYRAHAPSATAHPLHTGCGAAVPRPAVVPAPPVAEVSDEPPFEPERCSECRIAFEVDESYVGYYYSASQWWYAHLECSLTTREKVTYAERESKVPRRKARSA
jgi:hypothetical protein